ncbi:MAG: DUF4868 domain-containing protein, partial [Oscillospiraceae bacterium]|nr:DUF4868 domain-containing protein [Oscillospiraceae bacterium]
MDSSTLTEGLRALSSGLEWKFALYTAAKSRGGIELTWNACNMSGAGAWIETVRDALLKKPVADKPVAPYSPFLSDKENIAALDAADEAIRQQITELCADIRNAPAHAPEDFVGGAVPKPTGYAFFAEAAGEPILLLRRANPFLSGAPSARLCVALGNEIAATEKPVLKLAPTVDFLLLGGVCYFFSASVEKDFELENRHLAIAAKRLAAIAEAGVVSNIEELEKVACSAKNARKFVNFDKEVLEHITRLSALDREDFLTVYGVTVDLEGRMDTADEEQCELIIDLLCCRSCLDPLGRLAVGSNITLR